MPRLLFLLLCLLLSGTVSARELLLAKEYDHHHIQGWAMSEKLDGVRAYWDGESLLSRNGYPFTPPIGFTHDFPPFALDGELYSARGQFEQISAAVRAQNGDWSALKLHVFDVPHAKGNLYQRLAILQSWLEKHPRSNIVLIPQYTVQDFTQAQAFLQKIEAAGGEGVMLRNPQAFYRGGRSDQLLKLKSHHDTECTVTAHYPGKGKYTGKVGALGCKNQHGEFRIGSGLSDTERSHPPPIGTIITYRYRGFTAKGLPRFATYVRIHQTF